MGNTLEHYYEHADDDKEQKELIEQLRKQNELIRKENQLLLAENKVLGEYKIKLVQSSNQKEESLKEQSKIIDELKNNATGIVEMYANRQKRIFDNKVKHGFNVTNIYQEARYILEETAELMRAIEKNDRENMIEELADIIIFAYGCAEVARLGDLDTEVFKKMSINEDRKYTKTKDGDFVKTNQH